MLQRRLLDLVVSNPLQLANEIAQDARHTLRLWAKRPWQTGFAIISLAIGIGANTGVFSVVNALLLRSLPFRDPSHLVSLRIFFPPHDTAKAFHEWRRQSAYLADTALVEDAEMNIGGLHNPQRAHVAQASSNFFSILGAEPVLGRGFAAGEDSPGRNALAVIGYGLWQQLFAGNPRVLGSSIRVKGTPLTIIGVAPPGFDYPSHTVLWRAAEFSAGNNGWETIARLKSNLTWEQARAAFDNEARRLSPWRRKIDQINYPSKMTLLRDELSGSVKNASLLLMAGVTLILLIACTNVANLLLARTADRTTEVSIRSALGATRARLVQQWLTECLLLSSVAALAGLAVAFGTTSVVSKVLPLPLAVQSYSILDKRVLGFSVLAAVASGLFFGVLPALYAGRARAFVARGFETTRGSRLIRGALVAAQITLTIVLLSASFSVANAFAQLMRLNRGFDTRGLVTVSVSLDGTTRGLPGRQLAYLEEALTRVRQLPGVHSASVTEFLPLDATTFVGGPFGLDGRVPKENSMLVPVLDDYVKTMGARILYGREFSDAEVRADAKVAIVNETFTREFGTPLEALGHQVTLAIGARGVSSGSSTEWNTGRTPTQVRFSYPTMLRAASLRHSSCE